MYVQWMSMDVHWMPTDVHGSMTPLKYPFVHVDPLNHSFPDKTPHVQQINQKFNQTINPTIIIKYTQGYFFFSFGLLWLASRLGTLNSKDWSTRIILTKYIGELRHRQISADLEEWVVNQNAGVTWQRSDRLKELARQRSVQRRGVFLKGTGGPVSWCCFANRSALRPCSSNLILHNGLANVRKV